MAASNFMLGKASGGILSVSPADGTTNTSLVLPASGVVVATDANGNLGLGVSNPANYSSKLAVAGTIASVSLDGNTQSNVTADNTGKITIGGYNASNTNYLVFTAGGGAERLRIDSAGNVGIGTASPTGRLHISGDSSLVGVQAIFDDTRATVGRKYALRSDGGIFALRDAAAGSDRITVDANGNIGIGVTPSAWGSAYKALELGASGNGIYSYTSGTDMLISQNTYRDSLGNHRYVRSASATIYDLSNGVHVWYTAPSGTSGNAITWTNAMTLDVNGSYFCPRMYIDTTAAASNMSVNSAGQVMRSTSSKKYKTNIETIDNSYVDKFFDNARPIYYKSLSTNDNPNWGYWGFIAEEVAEVDKRLVHWRFDTKEIEVEKERVLEDETIEKYIEKEIVNDESKPMIAEGVMYERITVLLTAKVQEQQAIINDLKARIEILEGAK